MVGAKLRGRELHTPDVEELAERERVLLDGLLVDHAGRVVGVERREELAVLVDPDLGRDLELLAVRYGLAFQVNERAFNRENLKEVLRAPISENQPIATVIGTFASTE